MRQVQLVLRASLNVEWLGDGPSQRVSYQWQQLWTWQQHLIWWRGYQVQNPHRESTLQSDWETSKERTVITPSSRLWYWPLGCLQEQLGQHGGRRWLTLIYLYWKWKRDPASRAMMWFLNWGKCKWLRWGCDARYVAPSHVKPCEASPKQLFKSSLQHENHLIP